MKRGPTFPLRRVYPTHTPILQIDKLRPREVPSSRLHREQITELKSEPGPLIPNPEVFRTVAALGKKGKITRILRA